MAAKVQHCSICTERIIGTPGRLKKHPGAKFCQVCYGILLKADKPDQR